MAKLKISHEWWTAPAEASNGNLILVTGRKDLENVRATGKFTYRVTVNWRYTPADEKGMPSVDDSCLMEEVQNALEQTFDNDPVAVNTGIYTGDGERNWVFYARSLHLFQKKFNEALAPFPPLPLQFEAADDPQWQEYAEMSECEINIDD